MKSLLTLFALLASIGVGIVCSSPTAPEPPEVEARFLVWLDCDPDDTEAVSESLRLARGLCSRKSRLTVFLDGEAVQLMGTASQEHAADSDVPFEQQLSQITQAGGEIRTCPHCVDRFAVDLSASRTPARSVTRSELEQLKFEADQIFQFRKPVDDAGDSFPDTDDGQLTI